MSGPLLYPSYRQSCFSQDKGQLFGALGIELALQEAPHFGKMRVGQFRQGFRSIGEYILLHILERRIEGGLSDFHTRRRFANI